MKFNRYNILTGLFMTAVAFSCLTASRCDAQDASKKSAIYSADKVYTMAGEVYSPGQVLVVDGKIKAVGKSVKAPSSAESVELGKGSVLMPGLVDAYTQVPFAAGSSDEITDEITLDFKAINAIDWTKSALRRELLNGTTTMNACPGSQNVLAGIAAIIKTDENQQIVINDDGALLASMCNDPAAGNRSRNRPDSIFMRQPTNRMGVVWILRSTFNKAAQAPKSNEYTNLHQVLTKKRPLMVVSRLSFDINTVGTLNDEFKFSPIIVGGEEAYKIKQTIADRKYPVVLRPFPTGATTSREGSEVCWNQASVLDKAGITVALSGNDLLEQARFAVRNGFAKDKALAAITSTPAKLLGIDDHVGSIAVGKDADMIALSGDPLDLTTSIRWVMVNGKKIEIAKDK